MNIVVSQQNKPLSLPVENDRSNHNIVAEYGNVCNKENIEKAEKKLIQARLKVIARSPFLTPIVMNITMVSASKWLNTVATDGKYFYFNTSYILNCTDSAVADFFEQEIIGFLFESLAMKTVF